MTNGVRDDVAIELYRQACDALRHYSTCILQIRILVLAEGLVAIAGTGWLYHTEQKYLSIAASVFGLLFAVLLFTLQSNYWRHFEAFLRVAVQLEAQLGAASPQPWSTYGQQRADRHKSWRWRWSAIDGPFAALVCAFLVLVGFVVWTLTAR